MSKTTAFEEKCINTIRFLAADAIEKAKSGHPGMPMGAAAAAHTLWVSHLKHNPVNPRWVDRDRFVLSAGHASMLLYVLLHLTGYDLSMDDLKAFRQWESRTPGHPELHCAPGVEVTTGPLGQGLSNAVGMAIAEAHLAARFNRPDCEVVDHFTYVLASDGDIMEGVTAESCSLAGHLGLGKLIVLYDDNRVSLAGTTSLSFTEDVGRRFEAYGWQVLRVQEGNRPAAINAALQQARAEESKPSIISVQTVLGYGAPHKQGTADAHGSPLGRDELDAAKKNLGWPVDPTFFVPEDVSNFYREALDRGKAREEQWLQTFERYRRQYPEQAAEFSRVLAGRLPDDWEAALPVYGEGAADVATRKAGETVMQALAPKIPELMGGSADLNPSTFTWLKGLGDFQPPGFSPEGVQGRVGGPWGYEGRNIHYGVREHAMGAISVGMALHGGILPYTATFLTFADYMRPPIRLSALMGLRVIYVFTHDSIGLGEDGPTHQPIEHIMNLRAVPNLTVIRPADAGETVEAWREAIRNTEGPTTLIFSRQNLPVLDRAKLAPATGLRKGGYTLWESGEGIPDIILIGTGSEVVPTLEAGHRLAVDGVAVRVVSMPSWELFDRQPDAYREAVLPSAVRARVAVEAGIKLGWERYVGLDGAIVGLEGFGASAPAKVLFEKFGITVENVTAAARALLRARVTS
ncbi:transketolase [Syntrophus aciditrophicus]|uniref:Transketolase n=1 Tax=Syntrophus aciditrophicus (strain SB) TaxID=56780 RepID=Q2LQ36_SYNAS|nr:transketolase [Syntrophus aciditrophicus]ABC76129.1 transketolase [Syntrophus aciditrophicus SB]